MSDSTFDARSDAPLDPQDEYMWWVITAKDDDNDDESGALNPLTGAHSGDDCLCKDELPSLAAPPPPQAFPLIIASSLFFSRGCL